MNEPNDIVRYLIDANPRAWLIDEMDEALIGTTEGENGMIAVYAQEKILEVLMNGGMDELEAEEWFDFNIQGAYMGENMPVYVFNPVI